MPSTWNRGLPGHTVTGITGDTTGISGSASVRGSHGSGQTISTGRHGCGASLPHTIYDGSDGLRGDPFPLTAPAVARGGDGQPVVPDERWRIRRVARAYEKHRWRHRS